MTILTNLNTVLGLIQKSIATLGLTVAALMVSIRCIQIMTNQDTSPASHRELRERLQRTFIYAGVIGATSALLLGVGSIAHML
jgi:hypothetical protein